MVTAETTHVIVEKVEAIVVDPGALESLWLQSAAEDVVQLQLGFGFVIALLD